MYLEVVKGKNRYYYHLVAKNGNILLTSEGYYSKWNARRAASKLAKVNDLPLNAIIGSR